MSTLTKEQVKEMLKEGQTLKGIDLSDIDLTFTDLIGANLSGANFNRANFYSSDLDDTNFNKADLRSSDLSESWLNRANLSEANLIQANLVWSDLIGANLSGANLHGADLFEADLTDADLRRVNFSAVCLENTKGIFSFKLTKERCIIHKSKAYKNQSNVRIFVFEKDFSLEYWRQNHESITNINAGYCYSKSDIVLYKSVIETIVNGI